jgi:hypothetical protein
VSSVLHSYVFQNKRCTSLTCKLNTLLCLKEEAVVMAADQHCDGKEKLALVMLANSAPYWFTNVNISLKNFTTGY